VKFPQAPKILVSRGLNRGFLVPAVYAAVVNAVRKGCSFRKLAPAQLAAAAVAEFLFVVAQQRGSDSQVEPRQGA
jgi:hypothetical protein